MHTNFNKIGTDRPIPMQHIQIKLIFICILLIQWVVPARALLPGPQLVVTQSRKGSARVQWTIPRKLAKNVLALEIERADASQSTFRRIAQYSSPRARGQHIDKPVYDGRYTYRIRIRTVKGYSRWSKRTRIRLNPSRYTPPRTPMAKGQSNCSRKTVAEVIRLVNQARAAVNAPPLKNHRQLAWSARTHAIKMAEAGNFSHDGWIDYIRQSGFRGSSLAENIAWGYPTPSSVMNGWLNSPGHRANILNSRMRFIGVGCIQQGSTWWVQNFAG